jgi:hypothetical protein
MVRSNQQRLGGFSALYLALAYVVAMPYFVLASKYMGATTPAQKVAVLATEHVGMHVMYLITYVVFGLALGVLALALYDRLRPETPILAQLAAAVGLLWAVVLVASGLVFNAGMGAAVALYPTNPGQAAAMWQAIEPVADGLSCTDGELLGGLWLLLVSVAGVRNGMSRGLGWFGAAVGAIGVASMIPGLQEAAYAFGLLQIVWFVWLSVTMLRTTRHHESALVPAI